MGKSQLHSHEYNLQHSKVVRTAANDTRRDQLSTLVLFVNFYTTIRTRTKHVVPTSWYLTYMKQISASTKSLYGVANIEKGASTTNDNNGSCYFHPTQICNRKECSVADKLICTYMHLRKESSSSMYSLSDFPNALKDSMIIFILYASN